jgi:uncharacterized protein YjcR
MADFRGYWTGDTSREIAERFNISQRQVQKIVKGEAWSAVSESYWAEQERKEQLYNIAQQIAYAKDKMIELEVLINQVL